MALTAMDYIQIKQLVNRYAFAVDTGSRNGYDYADLFAPDGVFDSNTRGLTKGRDNLASLARGGKKGPLHVNHYIFAPHHRADGHRRDRPSVPRSRSTTTTISRRLFRP